MKNLLSGAWWFLRNREEVIGSICIGGMGGITAYNVICRYFFNSAKGWAEELSVMLLIWATFMGVAACYKRNLHVGMDFLIVRLPKRVRHWARTAVVFILLALFVYISEISWNFTSSITKTSTYFRMSYFYLDISVVVCFVSMAVYSCIYLYRAFMQPEKFDSRYENEQEDDGKDMEVGGAS